MPKIVAYCADGTKEEVYPEEKTPYDEVKLWVTQQVETSREVVKEIKAGTKTNVWADLPPPCSGARWRRGKVERGDHGLENPPHPAPAPVV